MDEKAGPGLSDPSRAATAILLDGFRSAGNTRVFENGWSEEAAHLRPRRDRRDARAVGRPAQHAHPFVEKAVIALVRPGEPSLSEEARERSSGAPSACRFSNRRIDESCNLLAAECEAHDGLHIESLRAVPREGEVLETAPCGCGRTTPRLITPARAENLRKVAAYAR